MTNHIDPHTDGVLIRHGLGSSTRGKTMDEHNKGRTEVESRAALARVRRDCETPSEREARERRDDAREHSTEGITLHVADNEPKFSDGLARKCFTCKGWLGGGFASCTVHQILTQTHLICNSYERHSSRYPALPAGEATGRVDPRGERE